VKQHSAAFAAVIGAACLSIAPAPAQEWPARPVKIIAPFAPGGSADTLGRIVAEQLSDAFKQQFFVENKPGAGGVIGSQQAAHAEPDGYTFMISGIASHVIATIINSNTGYDPVKDFTHVAYLGGPPIVIIVNPSLGVKTLAELIAYQKKTGQALTYASPGAGTNGHLVAEYFAKKAGIAVEHVPYRGAAPGVMDVVAGHLTFGSMTWTTASGHIQAGTVLPLAVSSNERLPEFPNVPTLKELGYPELVCTTWFSLSGPPGIPADIVQKLNREAVKAMQSAPVQKRLKQDEILTEPMDSVQFTKFVADEVARWRPISEHAGFKTH
jgi:tripartite-type tricarboxylate transporter receptor subunit TctC